MVLARINKKTSYIKTIFTTIKFDSTNRRNRINGEVSQESCAKCGMFLPQTHCLICVCGKNISRLWLTVTWNCKIQTHNHTSDWYHCVFWLTCAGGDCSHVRVKVTTDTGVPGWISCCLQLGHRCSSACHRALCCCLWPLQHTHIPPTSLCFTCALSMVTVFFFVLFYDIPLFSFRRVPISALAFFLMI